MGWVKKCAACGDRTVLAGYSHCEACLVALTRAVLGDTPPGVKPRHPEMTEPDQLARLDDTLRYAAEFRDIIDGAHLTSILVDLDDVMKDARFDRDAYQARIDRLLESRRTLDPQRPETD